MNHPDLLYANDIENNCVILKWGESGYYPTDYPKGKYTDDVVDELNASLFDNDLEAARKAREAMQICSMVAQDNPNLDWEKHYKMVFNDLK